MGKTIGRIAATGVAAFAISYLYLSVGEKTAFQCLIYYVLPLALVWFPEEMGGYTGMSDRLMYIDQSSPAGCIYIVGWFMVFLPYIMAAIIWVRS